MKKVIAAAIALSVFPTYALAASFGQTQNLIGVYGQVTGTPSSISASDKTQSVSASGSNTSGGIGVFANGVNNQLWFVHLGFNYTDGPAVSSNSVAVNGHSMQFNARIGKLFSVAPAFAVGPYLAYQYANFKLGLNGVGNISYNNNAMGGGLEVVTNTGGPFDIDAHVGYLAGVTASASADGYNAHNPPSSGVLQMGAKGVYSFTPQFSAFAGVAYDRYHGSYNYVPNDISASATVNEVRGMVGLAYKFG